jgi:hypothetical protein
MFNIAVSQEVLNLSGVITLIHQIIIADMAHHVTVNFDIKISLCRQSPNQLSHRISGHHLTAFGNENIFTLGQHLSEFFKQN